MTTEAQNAANKANAAFSTGPKTDDGKARSSKNALTFGLFTMNDFVRENEAEDYTKICTSLWKEISPEGAVEQTFATQIMSATWRLRRCGQIEFGFDPAAPDPMVNELTEKQQRSVDRARAQSHNILHRSLAELRKLQTERQIRIQIFTSKQEVPNDLGVMDLARAVKTTILTTKQSEVVKEQSAGNLEKLMSIADKQLCQQLRDSELASSCKPAAPVTPAAGSFCKAPETTPKSGPKIPRNALCPCRSGKKFKKCCGFAAVPGQNIAA